MKRFTIALRRDEATKWSDVNPVLRLKELGIELDTRLFKIGDGTTKWNDLAYHIEKMPEPMVPEFYCYDSQNKMLKDVPFSSLWKWPWSKNET